MTDSNAIKKCWYWPDTDTDTRIGAALILYCFKANVVVYQCVYVHKYILCFCNCVLSVLHCMYASNCVYVCMHVCKYVCVRTYVYACMDTFIIRVSILSLGIRERACSSRRETVTTQHNGPTGDGGIPSELQQCTIPTREHFCHVEKIKAKSSQS